MTTDEMVREIMQLQTAIGDGPPASTLHMHFGSVLATVRLGDRAVDAPTLAEGLDGLRGLFRDAAEKALAEHEAKAEGLRKALGIPSPAMAGDDLRAAVREWWAAAREKDRVMAVTTSIDEASEAVTRLEYAEDTLRAAMGGEL